MCRSDALIGLNSTRTSASPGAKDGVGISSSFNTLFGSPVSRKINVFINTSWSRHYLIQAGCVTDFGTRSWGGDEGTGLSLNSSCQPDRRYEPPVGRGG